MKGSLFGWIKLCLSVSQHRVVVSLSNSLELTALFKTLLALFDVNSPPSAPNLQGVVSVKRLCAKSTGFTLRSQKASISPTCLLNGMMREDGEG